jgi:hypothetical protein
VLVAAAVRCYLALAGVVAFVMIGFPCAARDGLPNSGIAGRKIAGGVGSTPAGGPGADAKPVDGGIDGNLANVVGASVAAQRGESIVPFSLVFPLRSQPGDFPTPSAIVPSS